jgi:HlyD family secretion protein
VPKRKSAWIFALSLCGLAATIAVLASQIHGPRAAPAKDTGDTRGWQAVAPGRVEPRSGEIKLAAPVPGRITAVPVKANDKVFAGEALIWLEDEAVRTQVAKAEAQVALRKRIRGERIPGGPAGDRRRAEDAVVDSEQDVIAAQSAVDRAAAAWRAGTGSQEAVDKARANLTRAQAELEKRRASLREIEADSDTPLPTANESQLNIARIDLRSARAALAKLTIRAPIDGTVLQLNNRIGELAAPSLPQPLLVLGDVSSLRVRAEVDERDLAHIKVGHQVVVRTTALPGKEFAGKVTFIAPIVEAGRINARGQRNLTDVNVAQVLIDLADSSQLVVGMKVDVYFRYPGKPAK